MGSRMNSENSFSQILAQIGPSKYVECYVGLCAHIISAYRINNKYHSI